MGNAGAGLECIRLTPQWVSQLVDFLGALEKSGDAYFFSPHPAMEEVIHQLATGKGKDLYYLLVEGGRILGYGMLRGWDEGYDIPSLGIAIHPECRGEGLARVLMAFLHAAAARRGASKVRLRVRKDNEPAIQLYRKLGYVFDEMPDAQELLVGFKSLKEA